MLYPQYITNPTSITKYFTDLILANADGHQVLSDILIAYFQSQICTAWDIAHGESYESVPIVVSGADKEVHGLFGGVGQRKKGVLPVVPPAQVVEPSNPQKASAPHPVYPQLRVPSSLIDTRPNSPRAFEEIHPFCASANNLINPLPPSLFYGSGWFSYHPPTSVSSDTSWSSGAEHMHYWYSTLPTSKLRIPINVGAGDIGIYYVKEPMGRGDIDEGSGVECWVDDNYGGARVIENAADVKESTPT